MFEADLEQFRSGRARTLAIVGDLSQAQMDYLRAPGKWSVTEVRHQSQISDVLENLQCCEAA